MQASTAVKEPRSNPVMFLEFERHQLVELADRVGNLTDDRVLAASRELDYLILSFYRRGLVSR
ncbi:Sporulation stage 0, Spo0E-like regulatory phosphatase [Sulfobacillus acidophilus DSM 10332]|uniref:Sporulation stage 0, Spo0E-like regulatory phosphatase n=1 Tax=Sulfobacillus acidophilus (strain ATCC 700253 / DSM 10332 / NAL) TaxID=679936 RepID=G8TXE3_SULAD|nr:Sporulation stage 0, Spo0E-like regulatory phosphatase [Sulfobacillus acidophilus DSM 10332]MCY0864588.1 aspartyl-phosphate phosphatase Spo0E family protein [Sulfobacillus sp.]